MASYLDEKKKRDEDALIAPEDTDTEADESTDLPETTETSEEDKSTAASEVYQPATKSGPSYVLVPLKQATPPLDTKTDEQVTGSALDLTDPNQLGATKLDTKTDEQVTAPPLDKGEAPATLPQVEKAQPVQPLSALDKGEAPAALDQVERASLVKLPAPDLGERGTPIPPAASVSTPDLSTDLPEDVSPVVGGTAQPEVRRAALAGETPKALPPEPVVRAAQVGVTPKAQPVISPEAVPVTPAPRQTSLGLTPDEYKAQYVNPPTGTAAEPERANADAGGLNINTDYTADDKSSAKGRGGDGQVHGIVLHSTDAGEKSSLETLTHGGVSAHYLVNEKGQIYNLVPDGDTAYHAGATTGPYANYNNSNTIGIEQVHVDGTPWAPAEVAATARLVAYLKGKHGVSDNDIMGHSDVAPGRKQDPYNYPWKGFFAAVDGAAPTTTGPSVAASGGKAGQQAAGVGPSITGKATTFGYNDPQDSGVGAPKLGQLDTNNRDLVGIAVPEEALRAYVGAHPQSWRTARVQVTTSDGKSVLVPIVDLGPRDTSGKVVADFTQGLTDLTKNTGEQNYQFRIIPNAGVDVMKDPQAFADEQAAIKAGINTGARFAPQVQAVKKPSYVLAPMAPKSPQQEQAEQFAVQGQQDTLTALHDNATNMPAWYHSLENPIPGVSDAVRDATREDFKKQITAYAQDYYKEPDPDKAFARIMSAPNLLTSAGEIWTKAGANFQHAWLSLAQQADSPTQTKLIDFINAVHPEATPEARTELINQVMSRTGKNRVDFVNHLYNDAQAHNPDSVKNVNMVSLLDSIDVSAQPGMQAKEAANHARVTAAVAQNVKNLREDPTMENTYGGVISNAIAQMPKNILEAITPVIGQSAMFSEIYTDTIDGLRKDHPDWSEDQIKAKAAAASLPQDVLQELVNAATLGMGSGVTRGITNPIARITANSILHGGIAATAGTAQQAVANVATGRLITEGLPQAAVAGGIQGVIGGWISGRHPEETAPEVTTKVPLGEEPAIPLPTTGPAGGTVHGATAETMASGGEETARPTAPQEANVAPTPPTAPIAEEVTSQEPAQPSAVHVDQTGQVQQPTVESVPPEAAGAAPVSEAEPWVSKIANRFTAERMATGDLGPVEPGVGVTKEEMLARGLKMGPEEINQHVSNIMNDVGGNPRDQAAAIRTEEARLSQVSRQASLASEAEPANQQLRIQADNAFKDLTDFHNGPVAKFKSNWHAQGKTLQGEIPVDLSTYNGLRDAYLRDVGKPPPANAEPVLRRTAQRVRDAVGAETASMQKLGAEIEKQSSLRRLPTPDQIAENIMKRMRVDPCPI